MRNLTFETKLNKDLKLLNDEQKRDVLDFIKGIVRRNPKKVNRTQAFKEIRNALRAFR